MMAFRKLFVVPFLFVPIPAASEQEGLIWIEYPSEGVVLGQGYNLLEDRPSFATCVDFLPVQDPSQQVEYRFEEVSSHTRTRSLTDISASGSMRMAILNASARLSFLSNEEYSSDTTKFFLTARVTNSTLFAAPSLPYKAGVTVPNPAGSVIQDSVPQPPAGNQIRIDPVDARNVDKCGHGFVAAIVSGAAIDAFLTYSKEDAEALADIRGGLKADIGSVFKVSGSFQQRQESVSNQERTSISLYRFGGRGTELAFDLTGLRSTLRDIVRDATQAPKPIRIGILPYRYLSTQLDFSETWTADSFSDQIDAFFLAKDVFERTDAAIQTVETLVDTTDRPERQFNDPILILLDARAYVETNTEAMRLANRLSTILLLCRQETNALNNSVGETASVDEIEISTESIREAAQAALGPPRIGASITIPILSAAETTNGHAVASLLTDEEWARHMTELYLRDVEALSTPLRGSSHSATRSDVDKDRIQYCQIRHRENPVKDGWVTETFLSRSVEYALRLQARELSMRPIYWNDLGALRKERIRRVMSDGALVAGEKLREIKAILDEFQEYIRTTGFRREICNVSFSHPVCGTDEAWINSAALAVDILPDLAQILKELDS